MSTLRLGCWVLWLGLVVVAARDLRAGPPQNAADTATLIEQLGSDDIPTQLRAIGQLVDRKLEADDIPRLQKAADMDNVLGSEAAIQLLSKTAAGDTEIAPTAREALLELSTSAKPHVAAGATQALRVLDPAANPAIPVNPRNPNGNFESVQSKTINGQRHIEVKTPERSIDIQDQEGKQIEITVTETAGGQETQYTAQDADDLKQKHPEIAELYEKYTKPRIGLPPGLGTPPGFGAPPRIGAPPRLVVTNPTLGAPIPSALQQCR